MARNYLEEHTQPHASELGKKLGEFGQITQEQHTLLRDQILQSLEPEKSLQHRVSTLLLRFLQKRR